MISKFNRTVLVASFASLLSLTVALAGNPKSSTKIFLTDVVVFGADNTGNWFGQPDIYDTRPNGNWEIWIQNDSDNDSATNRFLNGPTNANVRPDIELSLGTNSFRLLGAAALDNPYFGINLFFNGSTRPSISVYAPMLTDAQQPNFIAVDNAPNTPKPFPSYNTGYSFPGAGTFSFIYNNELITLTDFYWATPSVFDLDLVGEYSIGADGAADSVGGITIIVSPISAQR
jgi:hypothetical protein